MNSPKQSNDRLFSLLGKGLNTYNSSDDKWKMYIDYGNGDIDKFNSP